MIVIEEEKCIACGRCVGDCIFGNIRIVDGKADYEGSCMQCGHCVSICPEGAVSIPDYEMSDVEDFDEGKFGFDIDQFLYTIKARRSIRFYEDRSVERDKLEKIVQVGRYTATGGNRQDCCFHIVQDKLPELKTMIWNGIEDLISNGENNDAVRFSFKRVVDMRADNVDFIFRNAPVVVYISSEFQQNACLAAQNMELAAISQGLGVLYNGYLVHASNMNPEVLKWLDVGDKNIVISMLMGYPDIKYQRTAPRRKADVKWR